MQLKYSWTELITAERSLRFFEQLIIPQLLVIKSTARQKPEIEIVKETKELKFGVEDFSTLYQMLTNLQKTLKHHHCEILCERSVDPVRRIHSFSFLQHLWGKYKTLYFCPDVQCTALGFLACR